MQRHDEIGQPRGAAVVLKHVAANEFKSVKAETGGDRRAVLNDVGLEIDPRHTDRSPAHHGKIMVDRKREIAFSAAEIAYAQHAVGRQVSFDLAYMLEKAAYLAELRLFFVVNAPVRIADAESAQKRLVPFEKALLAAVVAAARSGAARAFFDSGHRGACADDSCITLCVCAVFAGSAALERKVGAHKTGGKFAERRAVILGNVPLERLAVLAEGLKLQHTPAADAHRPCTRVFYRLVPRHRKAAFFYYSL
ncbi:unknown [Anaerotruncus sp. CAG:390]|nr:unknown [Anaerotruncus sp. CAG:390]